MYSNMLKLLDGCNVEIIFLTHSLQIKKKFKSVPTLGYITWQQAVKLELSVQWSCLSVYLLHYIAVMDS